MAIRARDIPEFIKEAGGHRWQELSGIGRKAKIHTSTVTVSVLFDDQLNQPIVIRDEDFEVRFHRSTGCGGQRKNKVATCCVIKHIPTGMTQKADGRSRLDNEETAKTKLINEVKSVHETRLRESNALISRAQQGCGQRGDKRRTYRTQDNEVYDHRSSKSMRFKDFIKGDIERLW